MSLSTLDCFASSSAFALMLAASAHADQRLTAAAAEPNIAEVSIPFDRPGFGDTPATVPAGFQIIEAGYDYAHDGDENSSEVPVLLLRAGITENLELRLGWDGYASDGADGALETRVGFKLQALEQDGMVPDLVVIPELVLPTGDDDVASDKVQPEVRFAGGYDLTDSLSLGGNLNFASVQGEESEERFLEFAGSVVLATGITDALSAYIEYFAILPDDPAGADNHSINGGLVLLVRNNFQLDTFAGAGLDADADDVFGGVGAAYAW